MAVRMNLSMARTQKVEDVKKDFMEQLELLKTLKTGLELHHIYVYVASSIYKCRTCRKFDVEDVDSAVDFFLNRTKLKSKKLYLSLGADYTKGAEDLVITGVDY